MAQKKPVTFEDLDLHRLPLPLVAALQKLEEETESFRKVHRLIDTVEVFVKLHTVAIVADVFDRRGCGAGGAGHVGRRPADPEPRGVVDVCPRLRQACLPRGWARALGSGVGPDLDQERVPVRPHGRQRQPDFLPERLCPRGHARQRKVRGRPGEVCSTAVCGHRPVRSAHGPRVVVVGCAGPRPT